MFGVSARRMRAEARKSAARNANHKNARRIRTWTGKGAIMVEVCGKSGKKPMAQWNWEFQDRGSRTKCGFSDKRRMAPKNFHSRAGVSEPQGNPRLRGFGISGFPKEDGFGSELKLGARLVRFLTFSTAYKLCVYN